VVSRVGLCVAGRMVVKQENFSMQLKHIALVSSCEEKSDRFFQNLLGLQKASSKTIPSSLVNQIFNINADLKIINYANDNIVFEVFIDSKKRAEKNKIEHICIQVENLGSFLETCRSMKIEIIQVAKGDNFITFIKDDDGNLFEIKSQNPH
jgi:catechol 2,3-dioxygenase-like lactoylglutathione lyase family enzyme